MPVRPRNYQQPLQASASGYRLDKEEGPGDSSVYLQSPTQHSSALRDASSVFPASGSGGTFFFLKDEPKDGPADQGLGSLTIPIHTGWIQIRAGRCKRACRVCHQQVPKTIEVVKEKAALVSLNPAPDQAT